MDSQPPLEPASPGDLEAICRLLDENGLTSADIGEHLAGFLVARVGRSLAGIVGVEPHGSEALLRSLWEEHFRALGLSLGGGSGWAIVDYNLHKGDVRTYWAGNHTQTLARGLPLLVMDMYEHAYAIDYGAAAAKYIDSFFQNFNWDTVNGRLEAAEKASALLRR